MKKALFSLISCMLLAIPAARAQESSLFGPLQRGERAALLLEGAETESLRRVRLVPLLFVAGDHARNDIAGEWKEALEKEGLGEIPEIQDLYLSHIRAAER